MELSVDSTNSQVTNDLKKFILDFIGLKNKKISVMSQFFSFILSDVASIEPSQGSITGGTVITIKGKGFGTKKENVKVKVAGVPCTVLSVSLEADTIKCRTGKPTSEQLSAEIYPGK